LKVDEVRDKVKEWLFSEYKVHDNSGRDSASFFNYGVSFGGLRCNVLKPKDKVDCIVIAMGFTLLPEQQRKFLNMKEAERRQVIRKLQSIVTNTDLDSVFIPSPDKLKAVRLFSPIFNNGLTKDRLLRSIRGVRNTMIAVMSIIVQELGLPNTGKDQKKYIT
jgi:hypothetical protein